jgi:mitochondrial fission protein ELM1
MKSTMKCWGITDGSAGMVAQVRALTECLELSPEMKIISLPKWLRFFPNMVFDFSPFLYSLLPCPLVDYPDIIISCGRKAALFSAKIKRKNSQIKNVHIQDPQMLPCNFARNFDLIIAMAHDKIIGENVIKTNFALHSISAEKLAIARLKFAPIFADYPTPHIAVLLGGSTNKYTLTAERMQLFIADLQEKLAKTQGSLLITPSRRTGAENIATLNKAFAGNKRVYIYDLSSENPYLGLLACADEIIVSNDSVNMMSEAYATGKKVTILPLSGHKNTKPANFAEMLQTRPQMLGDEMQKLAIQVKNRLLWYN